MKCNLSLKILFTSVCLLAVNVVFSAEVNVPPGPDALFNAVQGASAGDVLVLADGGVYPNSASLPVSVPLTIKTADGAASKAKIVMSPNASNEYPGNMFNADASLTLKNIIANGQQGTLAAYSSRFINRGTIGAGGKIHVDGVEVSRFTAVSMGGDVDTLICENSLFNGNLSGAGGWGGTWDFQGDIIKYAKIQNNTFMFCTFGPYLGNGWGNYAPPERQQPVLIIDHNTMYNITGAHGPTTMFCRIEDVQFTNNLYINGTMRPNEFYSDKYIDFPQNQDELGDAEGQITALGPKGMWLISAEMVDSAGTVIDMKNNNISYTSDVLASWDSRDLDPCWTWTNETEQAIVDPENAFFEEQLTFVDAPATPMFAINAIADNAQAGNTDPAAYEGETPFSGWDWWSGLDANFDLREKSEMDMSYNTDAISYTAADGGFPLGDLNWFPDKKAEWEEYITRVETKSLTQPAEFSLSQNYPNPFNPQTNIRFTLPKQESVTLEVFDVLGKTVATLLKDQVKSAGRHNITFSGADLSSGLYFYRLQAGDQSFMKKMMLVR